MLSLKYVSTNKEYILDKILFEWKFITILFPMYVYS
jgi:hypothetical protein